MAKRTPARWLRRAMAVIAMLALLAAGLWLGVAHWAPSRATYPVQGIDVSHHQGRINWKRVHGDGVGFAYIKASEGAGLRDPRFAENWRDAKAAGIGRGAYHFFTLCRAGREQATNFIATVPREAEALPPVVDLEFGGNCAARPDRLRLLKELRDFIAMVEAHSEKTMILYVTREFDAAYRVSSAFDRPLWLRSIFFEPRYGAHRWVMWQANPRRRIAGISGPVDWNVVRGNE